MATTQGIRAGRAFVELFADDSRLVRGLRRAEQKLRGFGNQIRNMGLAIAGVMSAALIPLGTLTIKAAADAQETTSRFEQVFGDQAKAAGKFADELASAIGRSRYEVRDALATYQSFFAGLNFDPTAARQLSQQIQKLALDFASFNNISDSEALDRFIAGLSGSGEVFDRFGINIKQAALQQELLAMGVHKAWSQVTEQEKALARLNVVAKAMGKQGAIGDARRTADSFTNQMKALRGQLHDTAVTIGNVLLPVVTPLVTGAASIAKWFSRWAKENQTLIASIFKVGAGIALAGVVLAGLGVMISGVGIALGGLATALGIAATLFGTVGTAIGALLSPIGLVLAAMTGLGIHFLHTSGVAAQALTWLSEQFGTLKAAAMEAYKGIANALAGGSINLAAKILWQALEVQWLKGVNALLGLWLAFKTNFMQVAAQAFYGAVKIAAGAWAGLRAAWVQTVVFLKNAWLSFTSTFASAQSKAVGIVTRQLLKLQGLLDKNFDVEGAIRIAQTNEQADQRQIDSAKQQGLSQNEQQRDKDLVDIGSEFEGTLKALDAAAVQAGKKQQDAAQAQVDAANARLLEARKAYQDSLDEAKRSRPRDVASDEQGDTTTQLPSLDGLAGALQQAMARSIQVRGTFNAAAVQGLASTSDTAQRTASATEQTARSAKRIERQVNTGTLTFG